jgi:hypothetical protein
MADSEMTRITLALIAVLTLPAAPYQETLPASSDRKPAIVAPSALGPGGELAPNMDKQRDRRVLMHGKLAHAQKILEGVALNDFDLIAQRAGALAAAAEDPLWRSLERPEYRIHQSEFEQITSALAEAARRQDLEAASLQYVRLTLNCVRCHQCVRGVTGIGDR